MIEQSNMRGTQSSVGLQSLVMPVAVLFARHDSIYKSIEGCDVYDAERDARTWQGGCPVIAHPPCRLWGQMSHFSTAPESEKKLALWSVEQVRQWGGVLEHPAQSKLWRAAGLPEPGGYDSFGGFTLVVSQWWWGHKADKLTRLYIVGIEPKELPQTPYKMGVPEYQVKTHARAKRKRLPDAEREHTPLDFALWLIEVAKKTRRA